ncbi:chemotaxis protein CheV [Weizmannia acidilactici]|jgi:two-component system chemotaxis response regulator CheV|uniref:Chemotaxis protein CheV n=1 Tax=Weizmannia acidilactici TaxID=2607726 RepID=A0A5J4JLP0_9BACI|nr:chemotaxis protein [Weizmannia acidilactici]GER68125.1 chemotaxis protein CheV [Weizmannia acidilactici]GER71478.1 chemotaxis protein CheV [Weizmannia acidilactici]GER74489.1 chemotaxis protein CheV [Weizmannia acidilactici]
MNQEQGILLESGTNEVEIVEFHAGGSYYGINVIKVKEIIMPVPVTAIPHAHPYIEGIIQLRGEVLPVVNLRKVLGQQVQMGENDKFIVTEFNQQKIVFHVDSVTKIHRFSWGQIEKPSEMYTGASSHITGVIKNGGDMILMLDFEKIIAEINPQTSIRVEDVKKLGKRERSNKRILIAEDSGLLRGLLHDTLLEAGYEKIEFFENGKEAYDYLVGIAESGKNVTDEVQLVITDIEMPLMDGHHLTKKIKQSSELNVLPVIIFSSLITDTLRHKGEMVGADAQISKPEINQLILSIDEHVL